ncbi:MAG: hypothetical protein V3S69_00480 [Dehalococcoidales bacterium]
MNKLVEELEDNYFHMGHVNYVISTLLMKVARKNKLDYEMFNLLIGVLECAKLELYRSKVGPYEDEKKDENGDY